MDVQGAKKALPWLEKANASYVALVDKNGKLGSQFDFNYVPLTMLFNESGRLVRAPRYFDGRDPKQYQAVSDWLSRGNSALTKEAPKLPFKVSGFETPEAELRFQLAALLLNQGAKEKALAQLRQALEKSPGNFIILKQIWAIEHPERFYDGKVDFDWQRQQLQEMAEKDGN